ncbi:hypothetical protein RJD11_12085 [Bacillus velezensis]|uniref:hypothetical protein n=1 Tax=Bacillus velezensis TaxID=492670 RepID=UPI0028EC4FEC|nr:hypothetical protein [Bacillus velezensis]WNP87088.1 hypothetical protein RJD11_12085 [Bacillus velezensis]
MKGFDIRGRIQLNDCTYLTIEASDSVIEQLRRHFEDPDLSFDEVEKICYRFYRVQRDYPEENLYGSNGLIVPRDPVLSLEDRYKPGFLYRPDLPESLYLRLDSDGVYAHSFGALSW